MTRQIAVISSTPVSSWIIFLVVRRYQRFRLLRCAVVCVFTQAFGYFSPGHLVIRRTGVGFQRVSRQLGVGLHLSVFVRETAHVERLIPQC